MPVTAAATGKGERNGATGVDTLLLSTMQINIYPEQVPASFYKL